MKFLHRRRPASLVIAVAALMALSACSGGSPTGPDEPGELRSVDLLIPVKANITYFPVFVAEKMGYFKDAGIDITIKSVEGSSSVLQQLIGGNAEYGVSGAATAILSYPENDSLRSFGCYHQKQNNRLVALKGSGIASVADLAGKRIGVSALTGGEVPVLVAALDGEGISQSDVELVPVGQASAALAKAIKDGEVDAYTSGYNQMTILRSLGLDLADVELKGFEALPGSCLISTAEALSTEEGRADAIAIGQAFAESIALAAANPQKVVDIVCEANPADCADRGLLVDILSDAVPILTSTNADFPYAGLDADGWQLYADILAGDGKPVDVSGLLGSDDVAKVQKGINEWSRDKVAKDASA